MFLVPSPCLKMAMVALFLLALGNIVTLLAVNTFNTSNYIFSDAFVNATSIPYYGTIDPSMLPRVKKYGLDYFFLTSDVLAFTYSIVDVLVLICARWSVIYILAGIANFVMFALDTAKFVYKIFVFTTCIDHWFCMVPGIANISHRGGSRVAKPSQTYTIFMLTGIYILASRLFAAILLLLIKAESAKAIDQEIRQGKRTISCNAENSYSRNERFRKPKGRKNYSRKKVTSWRCRMTE